MKHLLINFLTALLPWTIATAQTLHYDRPADYFEEALVIGNGTMVGISVCMANGSDNLKKLCDRICPAVTEDGMAPRHLRPIIWNMSDLN